MVKCTTTESQPQFHHWAVTTFYFSSENHTLHFFSHIADKCFHLHSNRVIPQENQTSMMQNAHLTTLRLQQDLATTTHSISICQFGLPTRLCQFHLSFPSIPDHKMLLLTVLHVCIINSSIPSFFSSQFIPFLTPFWTLFSSKLLGVSSICRAKIENSCTNKAFLLFAFFPTWV